ncbi:MAG TPA: hypothetical protein VL947_09055, partial [Cytophagales bacterium]|nr:hypothetical protein [Cytophagales bacterium]
MKSEQELYFETERYIKKQMSPQERQDFEARLQQDPDLAHQVNLQALTHELTFKHRMLQASGVSEQIIATHKSERKYIKYG